MPGDVATTTPTATVGMPAAAFDDGAPVTTPRTPAREAAERELSKAEYRRDDQGLLSRILDWLWEHISSLLNSAAQASPGGWVGLAVITCVLTLLIVALRMRLGKLRPGPASQVAPLFADGPRSASGHRAAAERHAAAGRWNSALQERMRAIVRSLEERALLDHRPGRTADEAAVEAGRALPGLADALRSAARSFDEVTYAGRELDAAAYAAVRDLDSDLLRAEPLLPGTGAGQDTHRLVGQGAQRTDATAPDGGGS